MNTEETVIMKKPATDMIDLFVLESYGGSIIYDSYPSNGDVCNGLENIGEPANLFMIRASVTDYEHIMTYGEEE